MAGIAIGLARGCAPGHEKSLACNRHIQRAVGRFQCALAELLHKTLERRFQLVIKQFSRIKTNADLRLSWRRACKEATQIPASLWAVWTHPACDSRLEQEVYGDIHMIQHQIGAGTRADVRQLQVLEAYSF